MTKENIFHLLIIMGCLAGSVYFKNYDASKFFAYFPENGSRIFFIPTLAFSLYFFRKKHNSSPFWKIILLAIGVDLLFHTPEILKEGLSYTLRLLLSMAIGGILSILAVDLYNRFKKSEAVVRE